MARYVYTVVSEAKPLRMSVHSPTQLPKSVRRLKSWYDSSFADAGRLITMLLLIILLQWNPENITLVDRNLWRMPCPKSPWCTWWRGDAICVYANALKANSYILPRGKHSFLFTSLMKTNSLVSQNIFSFMFLEVFSVNNLWQVFFRRSSNFLNNF